MSHSSYLALYQSLSVTAIALYAENPITAVAHRITPRPKDIRCDRL